MHEKETRTGVTEMANRGKLLPFFINFVAMHKGHTIQKAGSITMLTLLYAVFFAAQLFSVNPDRPGRHNTVLVFKARQISKAVTVIIDRDGDNFFSDEDVPTLRLNKRFQPSEITLSFSELTYNLPPLPDITVPGTGYRAGFIPSSRYESVVLRGPPVANC